VTNVNRALNDGSRRLWWAIALGCVGGAVLGFIVVYGLTKKWGAEQWGPFAAWLSGALTLAAVVAAIRQAVIAQRQAVIAQQQAIIAQGQADDARRDSTRLQLDRLVDHEISRRRECIDAFSDLWAAIVGMSTQFLAFTQRLDDLDKTFDPAQQLTSNGVWGERLYGDELVEHIRDFFGEWLKETQPPLFRARLVLRGTPLHDAVKQINEGITKVGREGAPTLTRPILQGRRPDTAAITTMWQDVLRMRDDHLRLAEEHFSLSRKDAEAAVRENQRHM
jgi:hypothetical protein